MAGQEIEIHHIKPVKAGGTNMPSNLMALHKECHRQVTYTKDLELKARFVKLGILADIEDT